MKLSDLFEEEQDFESKMKSILGKIRDNPHNPGPFREAMNMVLDGNKSPELKMIIKSGVHSGSTEVIDEFVHFMSQANDKTFKAYSDLLTPKVRERFNQHPHAPIKLKKFERTKEQIKADKQYDTFIFVGVDKFKKTEDGKYERELEIESLVKVDKYNPADLNAVSMMKMRAHTREGGHVYIIKLPPGVIKKKVTHNIEPWLLHVIDEHKERI